MRFSDSILGARDLVLEIGTEELPAAWVQPALQQLQEGVLKRMRQEGLAVREARVYGTPRRLAIHLIGVPPRQPDTVIEVRGPAARQAFDADGNFTSAAYGFARSQGVFPEDLKTRRVSGGEYLFVDRQRPGLPTPEVMARVFPEVIADLTFPKMMRWGDGDLRFGRPIRWLLALYGDEVVPFTLAGIESGRSTRGHRTLSPVGELAVAEAADYLAVLRSACVLADPSERREPVRAQIEALAGAENAVILADGLLEEITFLLEWPTAFVGSFDPEFLSLPREALILVMRKQQRYFPLADADGALLPRFLGVRDGGVENLDAVRAGNERVLHARFSDIRFFYEEDSRVPLPDRVEELRRILYQERLGTLFEKTERLTALGDWVMDAWEVDPVTRATAARAALLAKADLATGMMKELPELQGTIGREYALRSGEPPAVADAIAEHYRPRTTGDALPESLAARVLGVADRLDTLVGHFAVGLVPSGSQDPYALRRQAAGLVALLLDAPPLSLSEAMARAYALYGDRGSGWRSLEVTRAALLDFLRLRLETALADQGVRGDTADAVLDAGFDDLSDTLARARALDAARDTPEFEAVLTAAVRVASLLRFAARSEMAAAPGEVRVDLLQEEPEQDLYGTYLDLSPLVADAADRGDYAEVLRLLGDLAAPVDVFFDAVLVMSDEESLRDNRLRLLIEVQSLFLRVADFSRLAGDASV